MLPTGPENSSRKLVWIEGQSFVGWGCSECVWVFNPSGLPTSKSFDELKQKSQMQLSDEFASHVCSAHPQVKSAKLSS
jgi:rubredoxin